MDFEKSLEKYLSKEEIDKLISSFSLTSKHGLLLNTNKISKERFEEEFPNLIRHPFVPNGYIFDKDIYQFGKHIYHEMGCYYLQEPSAMMISYLLNPNSNDILLDMCAAPGGKSVGAALLMNNEGVIVSNDISNSRAAILLNNIERMGIGNTLIINNDISKIYKDYPNYFSKIILDAPCSGSGMFRKDEEMKNDWSINKVEKFAQIQKELILYAYYMLKEGGTLIYSTCSYSYEEDEEIIDYLLRNSDAKLLDVDIDKSMLYQDDKLRYGYHLFPHLFPGEGHYFCLVNKPGHDIEIVYNYKIAHTLDNLDDKYIKKYGDYYFYLPKDVKIKNLHILRYGLKIKERKGKDDIYDYHLAHYLDNSCYINIYNLNKDELISYLKGNTIKTDVDDGMILLTYKDINLSFAKASNNLIKNHFPKYLRNKNYLL